jgi:hypothetical protein
MASFPKLARVTHRRFGAGVVLDVDERYTTVDFDETGTRKFVTSLLQLEACDLPLPVRPPRPRRRRRASGDASTTEHA